MTKLEDAGKRKQVDLKIPRGIYIAERDCGEGPRASGTPIESFSSAESVYDRRDCVLRISENIPCILISPQSE